MDKGDITETKNDFTISGNDTFCKRRDDVFSCLQPLASKHEEFSKCLPDDRNNRLLKVDPDLDFVVNDSKTNSKERGWSPRKRNSDQQSEGSKKPRTSSSTRKSKNTSRDTLFNKNDPSHSSSSRGTCRSPHFKKPFQMQYQHTHRRQRVPDYKINPKKWKKYSLEDTEDMSDSSNKKAAFAFLEERRRLREKREGTSEEKINAVESACSKGLISFKKPVRSSKEKVSLKLNKIPGSTSSTCNCEDSTEGGHDMNIEEDGNSVRFSKKSKTNRQIRVRHLEEEDDID